jgi:hypothetical protein
MLADKYQFTELYTDNPSVDTSGFDVVIAYWPNRSYCGLDTKKSKFIFYLSDLHHAGFSPYINKILNNADIILCPYKRAFIDRWPGFAGKMIFFPQFIAPAARFTKLPINDNPIKKCLLSGAISLRYPLRVKILRAGRNFIANLPHPGYYNEKKGGRYKVHDSYPAEINKYCSAIATSSVYGYTIGKYFEIPAAGSILVGNDNADMEELGFRENVNYVKINMDNCFDVIKNVVDNYADYGRIRDAGRKLIIDNHTVERRFRQICEIMEK